MARDPTESFETIADVGDDVEGQTGILRSPRYHFQEGDLAIKVENALFQIHSFHLQRSTTYFDEALTTHRKLGANEPQGSCERALLHLHDVRAKDFESLLWFFYESGYTWRDSSDSEAIISWEGVLLLADKYTMDQVAKVACHALDRTNTLNDVRKVSMCIKYGLPSTWAAQAVGRISCRDDPLTKAEVRQLGVEMTCVLARVREEYFRREFNPPPCLRPLCTVELCRWDNTSAVCYRGAHICKWSGDRGSSPHICPCPQTSGKRTPPTTSQATGWLDSARVCGSDSDAGRADLKLESQSKSWDGLNGDIYLEVEGRSFRLHSYHLKRASPIFSDMFSLPASSPISQEGATENEPIVLDVKAQEFEHLLWFFYDSQYEWSVIADKDATPKWESVLKLADEFDMTDISAVALNALDRAGILSDIRKIALCVKFGMGSSWAWDAVRQTCLRDEALTIEEACEIGPAMTASLALARETLLKRDKKRGKVENIIRSCIPDGLLSK